MKSTTRNAPSEKGKGMTLNTYVYISDEIDRHEVFKKCNELIGADDSVKWKEEPINLGKNELWLRNLPGQGLPAWLSIYSREEGEWHTTYQDAQNCEDYCDNDCDGEDHGPPCFIKVSFDTAYGYNGPRGQGCGWLHAQLLAQLGVSLTEKGISWKWQNEFTGEIHTEYDKLRTLYRSEDEG